MKEIKWKKIKKAQLENLHLLSVGGKEVGFIYKPRDSKTDKNAWRLHTGFGENTIFIGHEWNKWLAMKQVERHLGVA